MTARSNFKRVGLRAANGEQPRYEADDHATLPETPSEKRNELGL
jgi:hypothetical protein